MSKNNCDPTLRLFVGHPLPTPILPASHRPGCASYTFCSTWASPAGGAWPLLTLSGSFKGLVWGPVGGGCEGRAVSQWLRYFSSSCFSGDKGLPSPFLGPGRGEILPPVWDGVPEDFGSRQDEPGPSPRPLLGCPQEPAQGAQLVPFCEQPPPHLLETAAKA